MRKALPRLAALLFLISTGCTHTEQATVRREPLPFICASYGPGVPKVDQAVLEDLDMGCRLLVEGNLQRALAATRHKNCPPCLLLAQQVSLQAGGEVDAALIKQLAYDHPTWAAAWSTYSHYLMLIGNIPEGAAAAKRAADLWPSHPLLQKKWATARETLKAWALEVAPSSAPQEALARLETTERIMGADQQLEEARAEALSLVGREKEAAEILSKLGGDANRLRAAELLEKAGMLDEAMAIYSDLSQHLPEAKKGLLRTGIRWRLANLPPRFGEAAHAVELTRAQFCELLIAAAPEMPEPSDPAPVVPDIVGHRAQTEIVQVLRLGLLNVEPFSREFHPDRPISAAEVGAALFRLAELLGKPSSPCPNGICPELEEPVSGKAVMDLIFKLFAGGGAQ